MIPALALCGALTRSFAGIPNSRAPLITRAAYIAADVPDHKILQGANATDLMKAAYSGEVQRMKSILDAGIDDVNAQDGYGWTAFRYAIRGKQPQAALLLGLNYSADMDLPSKSGRTPLMSACGNNMEEMARGLVNLGADLSAVDQNGLRAFEHARTPAIKDLVDPAKEPRNQVLKVDLKVEVAKPPVLLNAEVKTPVAEAAGTVAAVAKVPEPEISESSLTLLVKTGEQWRFRVAATPKKRSLWRRIRGLFTKNN